MYAHKCFAYSAAVKDAFNYDSDRSSGLSSDGRHIWLATRGQLKVWQTRQGSYAEVKSIPCPGAARSKYPATSCLVQVFRFRPLDDQFVCEL
jgi:hypothetical protein